MSEIAEAPASAAPQPDLRAWLRDWLPELALLAMTSAAGIWAAARWVNPWGDPAYAWSLAYRLEHGERLYRDIYTQYTPLSLYLLAGGARLFGATARYFLFAYWVPAILAAFLLLRCARPLLSVFERLTLTLVVMATSLFLPGMGHLIFPYSASAVHALLLSMAALLVMRPGVEGVPRHFFLAGLLAGLAFACKQEIGIAALAALAVMGWLSVRSRLAPLGRLLGGFFAILLPLVLFILSSASYDSLRHDSRLWPLAPPPSTSVHLFLQAAGVTRRLWLAAYAKRAFIDLGGLGLLAAAVCLIARERHRAIWLRPLALIAAAGAGWLIVGWEPVSPVPSLTLSSLLAFFVAAAAFYLKDTPQRPFLAGFATFAVLVGVRTLFSPILTTHYSGSTRFASALTTTVALFVIAPKLLLGETSAASYLRRVLAIGLFCVGVWNTAICVRFLRYPDNVSVDTPGGKVVLTPPQRDLFRIVARNCAPGERALIIPETFGLDALFALRNVSPQPWATPGWFDDRVETQLLHRLQQSPPDVVVLITRSWEEYGSEPFGVGYGLKLSDWISQNFRIVGSVAQGQVLRRR